MFKFNTKMRYFKEKELEHLNDFMDASIDAGFVYETASGDAYHVLRLFQPEGLITKTTNYSPQMLDDNSRNFACPNSSIPDSKEFKIIYQIAGTTEQKSIGSKELMKKLGKDFKIHKAEKLQPEWFLDIQSRIGMKKAQAQANTETKEEFEGKTKTWTAGKRSESPKTKKKD